VSKFEKVVIVSTGPSWRIDGLNQAARRTGIDIDIPSQRQWTTEEVEAFRGTDNNNSNSSSKSRIGPGQAQCWLGHLNVLHTMLAQGWATALVMEDDMDWDVSIKQQLEQLAPLIRTVFPSGGDDGNMNRPPRPNSPYGDGWDLLWLGHCGELVPSTGVRSLIDSTLPTSALYRETYGDYSYFPPQLRMVYKTHSPLCTYAYALTSHAAMTIYQRVRAANHRIITTDLREWCQSGILRCVSVNPELFHHHKKAGKPSSQVAQVEGWSELAAEEKVDFTANIRHSARCNSAVEGELVTCQDEFMGPVQEHH